MAIVLPGAADLLNGLVNGRRGDNQATQQPRQAMVFTSRLRQFAKQIGATDAQSAETERLFAGLSLKGEIFKAVQALGYSKRGLMRNVIMSVNAKSVRFSQPKRIKRTDTRNGTVFWHFTNSRGQNNDILEIDFAGNTGNLDLRGSLGALKPPPAGAQLDRDANVTGRDTANLAKGTDTGALNKLLVWQNLLLMTREPMLIGDVVANVFTITYASSALPVVIQFDGFFDGVMEWEDSADKPNSKDYSFKFIVTGTEPPIDDYLLESIEQLDDANLNEPAPGSSVSGGGVQGSGAAPVS
jgi:hypothetical protein